MRIRKSSQLIVLLIICVAPLAFSQGATTKPSAVFTIDASAPTGRVQSGYLQMGSSVAGKSPGRHALLVNSRYLTMDSQPWLPVMGEFHYTRYPERYWEEEILKMKAGGIQIISTYVFWIHHEEVEGQFDWSGQRNLRQFVELCGKHGMYVYPRIGPWDHGEVRNGGFPDWLLKKGPTRVNDPVYLSYVQRFYEEVSRQLKGLLWKDGGPIVGIQLENEYASRAPNGGGAYISKLKSMAMAAGLDVPLYTVTGWGNAVYPPREVIPVFGGYPDEPWSESLQQLSPDTQNVYQFDPGSSATRMLQGVTDKGDKADLLEYPRFMVELGAGLQLTYHRRPVVSEDDIPPMALTALGSGVNLLGYYMFQGGVNPQGKLTTLQESQATGYPNDVPVKSYDFQAPLRAFGQMNGSFRKLKVIHQFVEDFGSELAPMATFLPAVVPASPHDTTTLRLAARAGGDRGYLFFNNYLRNYPIPEQKGVQVVMKLPGETIIVPRQPINVPSQTAFFWPINLNLGGALLKYATAQPLAKLKDGNIAYYFFVASAGIDSEFAFATPTFSSITSRAGKISREDDRAYVTVASSTSVAIEIQTRTRATVRLVLLSPDQAENSWKVSINGHQHLFITCADLFSDGDAIHLRSRDVKAFAFSVLPEIRGRWTATVPLRKSGSDGAFVHYTAFVEARQVHVTVEKVRDSAPVPPVKKGPAFEWRDGSVAEAPDDAEFTKAAAWRLTLPQDAWKSNAGSRFEDLFLDIDYVGDVGRLYEEGTLVDDNFYSGTRWEVGLKRFVPDSGELNLEILPLRRDAPIYMPKASWPDFDGKSQVGGVKSVVASPEYEVILTPKS